MASILLNKTQQKLARDNPLAQRLVNRSVATENGCWAFRGQLDRYGFVAVKRKTEKVHRLAYRLFCEPIPEGMHICHHCDNPGCINPAHLFVSTPKSNMRDMMRKKRGRSQITAAQSHYHSGHAPRGAQAPGAKLTEASAKEIILDRKNGKKIIEIVKKYGIGKRTVQDLLHGRTWVDLDRTGITRRRAFSDTRRPEGARDA